MTQSILLVDDVPAIRDMLAEAFTKDGFKVHTAGSAEEALNLLSAHQVDVIISDEKMPGMSGSQLLAVVRKRYPDTVRMILTGQATLESAIRAINEGEIYRFFTKPCNIVDLKVSIRQALEQKKLVDENRRLSELVKSQASSLKALEDQCPGITEVKRDEGGAVILEDE